MRFYPSKPTTSSLSSFGSRYHPQLSVSSIDYNSNNEDGSMVGVGKHDNGLDEIFIDKNALRNPVFVGNGPVPRPRRINRYLRFLIISSIIILGAAVGFLSWFWWRPKPNDDASWKHLMLSPYATQTITLVSILIRIATGILSGVSCSMIASIALEHQGVPLKSIAQISVSRYSNNPTTTSFFWLFGSALKGLLWIAAGILTVITLASQFTSTLLITDLKLGMLQTFPHTLLLPYKFTDDLNGTRGISDGVNVDWMQRFGSSETFAEYSYTEDTPDTDDPEDEDDTGPIIRAFMPLDSQDQRERLVEYRGMARIIDARVTCIRPSISGLQLCKDFDHGGDTSLCGTIRLSRSPRVAAEPSRPITTTFQCPLGGSSDFGDISYKNSWQLCQVGLDYASPDIGFTSKLTRSTGRRVGGYLIWHSGRMLEQIAITSAAWPEEGTTRLRLLDYLGYSSIKIQTWLDLNSTGYGPWVEQWHRTPSFPMCDQCADGLPPLDLPLTASYCFDTIGLQDIAYANITATRSKLSAEPKYLWSSEEDVYNVTEIRQQLGAVKETEGVERNIFTMSSNEMRAELAKSAEVLDLSNIFYESPEAVDVIEDPDSKSQYGDIQRRRDAYSWFDGRMTLSMSQNLFLCSDCPKTDAQSLLVNKRLGTIFYDTIKETNSPALAVQAIKTTIARHIYYDALAAFQVAENASLTSYEEVLYPNTFHGYWAVMTIITLHILLFFLLLKSFLSTQSSFLDNVWHTVAQISESAACVHILHQANLAPDKVIEAHIVASETTYITSSTQQSGNGRDNGSKLKGIRWRELRTTKTKEPRYIMAKNGQVQALE